MGGVSSEMNRRGEPRLKTRGWCIEGRGNTAKLVDLSRHGARLEFVALDDFELDLGSCVIIPLLGVRTTVAAVPQWQRYTAHRGGLEVGIRFTKPLNFY